MACDCCLSTKHSALSLFRDVLKIAVSRYPQQTKTEPEFDTSVKSVKSAAAKHVELDCFDDGFILADQRRLNRSQQLPTPYKEIIVRTQAKLATREWLGNRQFD